VCSVHCLQVQKYYTSKFVMIELRNFSFRLNTNINSCIPLEKQMKKVENRERERESEGEGMN